MKYLAYGLGFDTFFFDPFFYLEKKLPGMRTSKNSSTALN